MHVRIEGDGVAARCCAYLLRNAGIDVSFAPGSRPRVPVILLSEAAQTLIREIFERDALFRGLPRITRRVVKWGAKWGAAAVELPHSAIVISEETLLDALATESGNILVAADWTIRAAWPLPAPAVVHRFGSRLASAIPVEMSSPEDTCWIESLENGWLFLNSGWLLAVGGSADELLEQSTLVRPQIASVNPAKGCFPASPRIVSPLSAESWIACGSAAMAFDPLCGDGTAHAVREAILASAVIKKGSAQPLLAHYESRLTAGFHKHLQACRQYYSSGGTSDWWKAELESVEQGIAWCEQVAQGPYRYRLQGLDLLEL